MPQSPPWDFEMGGGAFARYGRVQVCVEWKQPGRTFLEMPVIRKSQESERSTEWAALLMIFNFLLTELTGTTLQVHIGADQ